MDKKAGYFIGIGVVIISVLFAVLVIDLKTKGHHEHPKIVKQELENADDVKGVFQNVYVEYEAPEEEHELFVSEEKGGEEVTVQKIAETPKEEKLEEGVLKMEDAIYSKHKKPIVYFTHLKHIEDYKIACGDCHHDDSGEPLNDITLESSVEKCSDCHDKAGMKPKGKEIAEDEAIFFHAEALHANCINCHRDYNKEKGGKKAPNSCKECHLKKR